MKATYCLLTCVGKVVEPPEDSYTEVGPKLVPKCTLKLAYQNAYSAPGSDAPSWHVLEVVFWRDDAVFLRDGVRRGDTIGVTARLQSAEGVTSYLGKEIFLCCAPSSAQAGRQMS